MPIGNLLYLYRVNVNGVTSALLGVLERSKDRSKAEFNAESNGATYVAIRALDRELRRSEDNRNYNLMFYPFKLEIRATLGNSRINRVYQTQPS